MIRRPKLETNISHERWLVSYADFITLLFAFFVLMYSVSQVSEQKYEELSEVLEATFSNIADATPKVSPDESKNEDKLADLTEISEDIVAALSGLVSTSDAVVHGNEAWIEVALDANLLFSSGKSEPNPKGVAAFKKVAGVLSPFENAVSVAGHTDNIPIANSQFNSNWQLSTGRAVEIVTLLEKNGVSPERLSATGYGEFRPIADNSTNEGRTANRRVVLRIAKDAAVLPRQDLQQLSSDPKLTEQASLVTDQGLDDASGENAEEGLETVDPVRLRDGGLLFSSDPELPRKNL